MSIICCYKGKKDGMFINSLLFFQLSVIEIIMAVPLLEDVKEG
jgi:hypothetical protein